MTSKELVIEVPTCRLRWAKPYDGYQTGEPTLQQLWQVTSGETTTEEWRDVPEELTYV